MDERYRGHAAFCQKMAVDSPTADLRSEWTALAALWRTLDTGAIEILGEPDLDFSLSAGPQAHTSA
jgi:hypothetical protein